MINLGWLSPTGNSLELLRNVSEHLKSQFPLRAEQYGLRFEFEVAATKGRMTTPELVGYQLTSEDGKRNLRLTLNDFAFSQLAPYDRWEAFRSEARRTWDELGSEIAPERINRVSVRFINRIDIPNPDGIGVDMDLYFRTSPRIAPELPQVMRTHFLRLELPFPDRSGVLVLTQTVVPPQSPNVISAVLDIDVIVQNVEMDVEAAWRKIEELRDEKNAAFEYCITDEARKLFD